MTGFFKCQAKWPGERVNPCASMSLLESECPPFDLPWPNGFCPAAQKDRRYILGLLHGMEVWSLAIPSTVGSQQAFCIFGSFDDLFCPNGPGCISTT